MADNSSSHASANYDAEIAATLPYLDSFYWAAIDVARAVDGETTGNRRLQRWLDTGCGTGTFGVEAMRQFPDTEFTFADPSAAMLGIARERLGTNGAASFELADTRISRRIFRFDLSDSMPPLSGQGR